MQRAIAGCTSPNHLRSARPPREGPLLSGESFYPLAEVPKCSSSRRKPGPSDLKIVKDGMDASLYADLSRG